MQPEIHHIAVVARELFVGSLPHLHHLDAGLLGQPGDEIKRDADPVGDGLVLMVDQIAEVAQHVLLVDQHFVMVGLELGSHPLGVVELVEVPVVLEADGERFHRPLHEAAHEGHVGR